MANYISKLVRMADSLEAGTGMKLSGCQRVGALVDYLWEHYVHGVYLIEYNQYRFYWKNQRERRTFVCYREFERIIELGNKESDFKYFDIKPLFNRTFSDYMGRDWVDVSECTFNEFKKLALNNSELFVKPVDGMCGRGAYKLKIENDKLETMYEQLKSEKAIAEEVVIQHHEIAKFNPGSVNTMRIVTFLKSDGEPQIMAAVIRLGRRGQVVDNFHNYGIVALIDPETGIVKTTGVDRDFKRYVIHPDSKEAIVGFKIPNWKAVLDAVRAAAKVVPTVRYVGWDVSVQEDGTPIMIEGNKSADHDVTQVTDQVGKWPMYKKLLDELN